MDTPARYTSIVMTSYIDNPDRANVIKLSLESLVETTKHLPVEIIVVNNGGDFSGESDIILNKMLDENKIVCYVKNSSNAHFGQARNQGMAMAHGNYIAIVDNDILYKQGWLEKCLDILEAYPDKKIYATPIQYPMAARKYAAGELELNGENYHLNMRAGSNCFVVRRKDFEILGNFLYHRVAGSKWTDKAVRSGYYAAVTPTNMVSDMGLGKGYNFKASIPIKRTLLNGTEIWFNEDELNSKKNAI